MHQPDQILSIISINGSTFTTGFHRAKALIMTSLQFALLDELRRISANNRPRLDILRDDRTAHLNHSPKQMILAGFLLELPLLFG